MYPVGQTKLAESRIASVFRHILRHTDLANHIGLAIYCRILRALNEAFDFAQTKGLIVNPIQH